MIRSTKNKESFWTVFIFLLSENPYLVMNFLQQPLLATKVSRTAESLFLSSNIFLPWTWSFFYSHGAFYHAFRTPKLLTSFSSRSESKHFHSPFSIPSFKSLFTSFCKNNFFKIFPPFSYTLSFYATFLYCWSATVFYSKFDNCFFQLHCKRSSFLSGVRYQYIILLILYQYIILFYFLLSCFLLTWKLNWIWFALAIWQAISKLFCNAKSSTICRIISPLCAKIVPVLLRSFHFKKVITQKNVFKRRWWKN